MAEETESRGGHWWAAAVAIFLVLYPLSAGPVIALYARLRHPEWMRPVLAAYGPVNLAASVPGVEEVWQRYITWWYEEVGGGS